MNVVSTCTDVQSAAEEEVRVYNRYNNGQLVCVNPNRHRYVAVSSKRTKRVVLQAENVSEVFNFLRNDCGLNLGELARRMWPNYKDAGSYMSLKLTGKRPFTKRDAGLAKREFARIASTIFSLE